MNKLFLIIVLIFAGLMASGQYLNRIETDFSLKEKDVFSNKKLSIGKVYYDKTIGQLIFRVSFPTDEIICVTDSMIYRFRNDSLLSSSKAYGMLNFSIFSLFLNGNLSDYGLKQSPFELADVSKDGNMVISTWSPQERIEKRSGKMMLSQIDKKIFGLVSFNPSGEVISKQFFEDYQEIDGYSFPMKIVQYLYSEKGEEVKVSTYRNVRINNYSNEALYHYPVSNL